MSRVWEVSAPPIRRTHPQIRVAQALYPTASLVNHACAPSAHASFRGRRIAVRATRDLPAGGRVLIAYGPQAGQQAASERRWLLRTSHAFRCACAACEHGAAADAELEGLRCGRTPGCDGAVPADGAPSFAGRALALRSHRSSRICVN